MKNQIRQRMGVTSGNKAPATRCRGWGGLKGGQDFLTPPNEKEGKGGGEDQKKERKTHQILKSRGRVRNA